ncbi:MAG: hypothetical protein Q9183_003962 [Haloplaca sp. 2 TL-2023]
MPASLSSLPIELLVHIIQNLSNPGDLRALALCSSAFIELVIPRLYEYIRLEPPQDGAHRVAFPELYMLVIRLIQNPFLASRILKITLADAWSNKDADLEVSEDDLATIRVKVEAEARKSCKGWAEEDIQEYVTALEYGDEGALLALLFQVAINVEVVNVVLPRFLVLPCRCGHFYFRTFQGAVKPISPQEALSRPLHKLRIIANSSERTNTGYRADEGNSTDMLHLYMQLPSVREIYVQRLVSCDSVDNGSTEKPVLESLEVNSSNVEHLELRICRLDAVQAQGLFGACRNLKTLVYDIGQSSEFDFHKDGFQTTAVSFTGLRDALLPTQHTLENLWIDFDKEHVFVFNMDDDGPITSLRTFTRLRNLKVGMSVLFGPINYDPIGLDPPGPEEEEVIISNLPNLAAVLPDNLETLYISHTEGRIGILSAALEQFLQVKRTSDHRLAQIAIEINLKGNFHAPSLESLERMAEESDVRLKILTDPPEYRQTRECGRGREDWITWAGSMEDLGAGYSRFMVGLE